MRFVNTAYQTYQYTHNIMVNIVEYDREQPVRDVAWQYSKVYDKRKGQKANSVAFAKHCLRTTGVLPAVIYVPSFVATAAFMGRDPHAYNTTFMRRHISFGTSLIPRNLHGKIIQLDRLYTRRKPFKMLTKRSAERLLMSVEVQLV